MWSITSTLYTLGIEVVRQELPKQDEQPVQVIGTQVTISATPNPMVTVETPAVQASPAAKPAEQIWEVEDVDVMVPSTTIVQPESKTTVVAESLARL